MIISDSICNQIGDAIFFESTPIWGTDRVFTGYTDVIIGNTINRYFRKEFRYSFDGGIIYTDWLDLDDNELQNISIEWDKVNGGNVSKEKDERSDLKFQFKYERTGSDNTGTLEFKSITINGTALPRELQFIASKNTIFSDIINNNIDVFNMTMNIVEKFYEHGIMPEFLDRKNEEKSNLLEDRDYIDFWKSISEFYAIIFIYVLRFTKIYWKKELLCEYLLQKGIFFCKCEDIIEMQLISQNFYDEIRQRGTVDVFYKKNHEYPIGNRFSYIISTPFYIMPSSPIMIDGIKYFEFDELPFGWQMISDDTNNSYQLISPDRNYHEVLFYNELTGKTDLKPNSKSTIPATEYSGILKTYDGEYLRLICYNEKCDEFIYNQVNIKDFGLNVGNSSPLYKGLDDQYGSIVKAYEKSKDFNVLLKYPWFGDYTIVINPPDFCEPPILINYQISNDCSSVVISDSYVS